MVSARTRHGYKVALFLCLQIGISLVLGELAIRVLARFNESIRQLSFNQRLAGKYEAATTLEDLLGHTQRGFRPLTPAGGFRTNSKSFRTREYALDKAPGDYRVITLGDSFTFASGLTPFRDHWPVLLGSRLRRELRVPAEVVNLGYSGIGPQFELRIWQLEGSTLRPDLVILAFYVGNDFLDGQASLRAGNPVDALAEYSYLVRVGRNLYRHKVAEETLTTGLRDVKEHPDSRSEAVGGVELFGYDRIYDSNQPSMPLTTFVRVTASRMDLFHSSNQSRLDLEFGRIARILTEIHKGVERSGAEFLMMIIPAEFQVDPEVARAAADLLEMPLSDFDLDRPQRLVTEFCKKTGIECIDLLPAFREAGIRRKLYRKQNTHWNVEGNALAVEELMNWASRADAFGRFENADLASEPFYDSDGDGVEDRHDACPATATPESRPTKTSRRTHFVLLDDDRVFDAVGGSDQSFVTIDNTGGCSCEQILRSLDLWARLGDRGCPQRVLRNWAARLALLPARNSEVPVPQTQ